MELDEDRRGHDKSRSRNSYERRDVSEEGDDAYMEDAHREKDRPRESGRHKTSHRKKDRHEGSERDRDRDKERDREDHDHDKEKYSSKERKREHRDERERGRSRGNRADSVEKNHEKDRPREKERDKDRDLDRRSIEREHERAKERMKERVRDKDYEKERVSSRDYERGKERVHDRGRERDHDRGRGRDREEREKYKDYDRENDKVKDKEKDKGRDRGKDKERDKREKDRERYKDKEKEYSREDERTKFQTQESMKENEGKNDDNTERQNDAVMENRVTARQNEEIQDADDAQDITMQKDTSHPVPSHVSASELQERIKKVKEERLRKKTDNGSEIASWVNKSRVIEEKIKSGKEKASIRLRTLEDDIQGESDDEDEPEHTGKGLAGVKVLHGLDKVLEGGAVVLTLKDQNILADGDLNEDMDVLENIEIGEQIRRDQAYKAAKKSGTYEDKFVNELEPRKSILPQYDDPIEDEGVSLDESGRFSGEAEKKLEELRKRIEGGSVVKKFEDLISSGKASSDYYTSEEMLQFKKPKKKKSIRKKDKLDLDALEAEAKSAGLGSADLGSRKDGRRQSAKEQLQKSETETRNDAYQLALAKAEEASKSLRLDQTPSLRDEDDDDAVFGDDFDDLQKSLEQARRFALKKQDETSTSGPQAVALQALAKREQVESINSTGDQENRVVITEMEEFVLSLQLNEDTHKPEAELVFMDEDLDPNTMEVEAIDDSSQWTVPEEVDKEETSIDVQEEELPLDETIHEVAVGKGLSGALKLLQERGTLKETVEWGGRNMDKKKSKLVGIHENDGPKEIHIERTDEFGRILTPKEAFRVLSHKFHGKGPGKMKQEKRMKQYQEELKLKQMKASDTPSQSVERMREAQARLKTPYLVLSGHIKPGQTSDPRSGFATVEKDLGSLTPMLGDRKVEHFLGIKRKDDRDENGSMRPPLPKKPRT